MTDGKNAVGLKGFPTPNNAAGISGYLLFLLDDQTYAQWILGACEALGYAYNWYESGEMSTDEAAELFRQYVQDAPYNLKVCANPSGGKILHVAPSGHVEQLSDANTWETPDGDYTIPPVPEREGGSAEDQICLAAKNAANVLELLYENVTDSFNNDLDEAEAATALTLTLVGLIGAEFAPITFALVTFFAIVFSVLYGLLEFLGADLWDADFTKALVCILQGCASNDAGVVTFDYECFNNALAAQVVVVDLTFEQLRLFGQIQYLLLVIGGVDALNAAGATTAITEADCDCGTSWSYQFDFAANGKEIWDVWNGRSTWVDGVGFQSVNFVGGWPTIAAIRPTLDLDVGTEITDMWVSYTADNTTYQAVHFFYDLTNSLYYDPSDMNCPMEFISNLGGSGVKDWMLEIVDSIETACTITGIAFQGTGSNPFGADSFYPLDLC